MSLKKNKQQQWVIHPFTPYVQFFSQFLKDKSKIKMDLYFIREEVLMDKTIYRSIKYKGFYRRDRGGGEGQKENIKNELLYFKHQTIYKQKVMISDSIQIVKTDGQILCQFKSNQHITMSTIRSVIQEVIEHSRKLNVEAFDNDIIEILSQGCYVYFRNHRSIIIIVIVCCSFSYQFADQLILNLMNLYDEALSDIFGQLSLPKYLTASQVQKLNKLSLKIEGLVRTTKQKKQNKLSIKQNTHNSRKMIELLEQKSQNTITQQNIQKQQQVVQMTKSQKRATKQLVWILKSKKYILLLFFMTNIFFLFYFFVPSLDIYFL